MTDHPPLVYMEKLGEFHRRNRVGNCHADREIWPCRAWRDAEAMNHLHAELIAAQAENEKLQARLEAVELERDEWGGKASTAAAIAMKFQHQRDQLVNLLNHEVMPHYSKLCEAAGLPDAASRVFAALEHYQPKGATP